MDRAELSDAIIQELGAVFMAAVQEAVPELLGSNLLRANTLLQFVLVTKAFGADDFGVFLKLDVAHLNPLPILVPHNLRTEHWRTSCRSSAAYNRKEDHVQDEYDNKA